MVLLLGREYTTKFVLNFLEHLVSEFLDTGRLAHRHLCGIYILLSNSYDKILCNVSVKNEPVVSKNFSRETISAKELLALLETIAKTSCAICHHEFYSAHGDYCRFCLSALSVSDATIALDAHETCSVCLEPLGTRNTTFFQCKKHIAHIHCASLYNRKFENGSAYNCPMRCKLTFVLD